MPLLAAAIFAGAVGCAPYPRTPAELEEQARRNVEAVERGEASRGQRRAVILFRMAHRWDGFRVAIGFRRDRLLMLKAICLYAQHDWSSEVRALLWGQMVEFANIDGTIFFRQERTYSRRDRVAIAQTIVAIGRDLRAMVQHGILRASDMAVIWGNIENMAELTLVELDAQDETDGMVQP